jgi:hypothetical protein
MEKQNSQTIQNRRKNDRYRVHQNTKAIWGRKELRILDVSKGGLGVSIEGEGLSPGSYGTVDIDFPQEEFFLGQLPVSFISHCELEEEFAEKTEPSKRCGMVFGDLRPHQRFQLSYFIWLHTHAKA